MIWLNLEISNIHAHNQDEREMRSESTILDLRSNDADQKDAHLNAIHSFALIKQEPGMRLLGQPTRFLSVEV